MQYARISMRDNNRPLSVQALKWALKKQNKSIKKKLVKMRRSYATHKR